VAVVEVADTGPGIAEHELASVFLEYRQAGDASSRRKGTGLGLAIARRLVRAHDGEIELTSEVGRGSTFRVTLPSEAPP
jgi:two-component system OmpR family sensor kinase